MFSKKMNSPIINISAVTGKKSHASLRDKIKLFVSKLNISSRKEVNVTEREKKGNI